MKTKDSRPLDIGSPQGYPAGALSNFYPYRFIFDGIICLSAEGLLQALKFSDFREQKGVCKLIGYQAKKTGRKRNKIWQASQTLWWRGKSYQREGAEYQKLLDKIFKSLSKNPEFRQNLLATGKRRLIHSIGESNCQKTVLTEEEFCRRLSDVRKSLILAAGKL